MDGKGSAVRPLEQPPLLQRAKVLAYRRLGYTERGRKLADASAPAHRHELGDARLPLVRESRLAVIGTIRHRPKRIAPQAGRTPRAPERPPRADGQPSRRS